MDDELNVLHRMGNKSFNSHGYVVKGGISRRNNEISTRGKMFRVKCITLFTTGPNRISTNDM